MPEPVRRRPGDKGRPIKTPARHLDTWATTLAFHYRSNRAHQLDTYRNSRLHIEGVDQRQFTGGGAAYGQHALAAFNAARAFVFFLKRHRR